MKKSICLLVVYLLFLLCSCSEQISPKETVKTSIYPAPAKHLDLPETDGVKLSFLASDNGYFYKSDNEAMNLFYIKGVNMGLTEATTDLNNPNVSYDTYREWFDMIREMNANTVRAFTVMNPNFYKALYDHNIQNKEHPLYLIQGIWFSEDLMYELKDAWESDEIILNAFKKSIKETIDIVHGNSDYTVYGEFSPAVYEWDISSYVAGYVLGLEYPSDFVKETNASHPEKTELSGRYLKTKSGASPFEVFLATVGEYLIETETSSYSHQTPVAFLNWQALDTLSHSNEPYKDESDSVSVNTENIAASDKYYAGLFAAVDVYPYYPEFMNHQEKYISYTDQQGKQNPFKAYIRDLKTQYNVPLMIAEYGLSTSRGKGHISAAGYDQGGLTEQEQGELVAQMTSDIAEEGCCGGLIFSWQDEWFKKTWNTIMYYPDNPADRTQNLSSAEQSYGLLQFDTSVCYPDGDLSDWNNSVDVDQAGIKLQFDANYLHILVKLPENHDFGSDTYYVPIATTGTGSRFAKNEKLDFSDACDFLLVINGEQNTRILCDAYQDVFHDQYAVYKGVFGADKSDAYTQNSGIYNRINTYVSNEMYLPVDDITIDPVYYEGGLLKYGNCNPNSESYLSNADFYYSDGYVEIRIAWYLLNVFNSRHLVAADKPNGSEIKFVTFENISIGAGESGKIELSEVLFTGVDNININQRLKKSYGYVQNMFGEIDIGE